VDFEGGHHKYCPNISGSDENPVRIDGDPSCIEFRYLPNVRSTALLFGGIT